MRWRGAMIAATATVLAIAASACGSAGKASGTAAAGTNPSTTTAPATTAPATTTTTAAPSTGGAIDLSGTPGVTPAEQHRAETLLTETIASLKRFPTPVQAYAAAYRSIRDRLTGDEHYVNWSLVSDGHVLDPLLPESLVYEERDGQQHVAAAMYMLPFGSRFTDAPDVGGPLTQWHVHGDLCLTNDPVTKTLSGFVGINGTCAAGSSKAGNTPMLHVWVQPNRCGPFAALEGVGAGQVPTGEERLCDTRHAAVP